MMLAVRTTANHLFCCVNQFLILVFEKAKSSLVRCTFSSLTAHSTSLNGIGFARVFNQYFFILIYFYLQIFTVRITGFSDSNTSDGHQFSLLLVIVFQNSSQLPFSQYNTYENPHFHPYKKEHSPEGNMVLHILSHKHSCVLLMII